MEELPQQLGSDAIVTSGYCKTDQACPDCAEAGYVESLYSNGTRILCSFPWCGFDKTLEIKASDATPWTQPPPL